MFDKDKFLDFFIYNHSKNDTELKKKSEFFLITVTIVFILGIAVSAAEYFSGLSFIRILPVITGVIFVLPVFILLKFTKYHYPVMIFIFFSWLVIAGVPFFDPVDNIFEVYRYGFLTIFFIITVGSICIKKYQLIFQLILINLGLASFYMYKMHTSPDIVQNNLFFIGFIACALMSNTAGLISIMILEQYKDIIKIAEKNRITAEIQREAYGKFVPQEILSLLDKKSIADIELGSYSQKNMTVMFTDIRDFTSLSETMTPEENIKFLNSYLSIMTPIIHSCGGYIDKYIGDSIMALFPEDPTSALQCSITMLKALDELNKKRINSKYMPIRIGIGLNTGSLVFGTIGGKGRMDCTVISDTVNLSSRIESLTKLYLAPILISENTLYNLNDPSVFNFRFVDNVIVKGKKDPMTVFEILDGLPAEEFKAKMKTKDIFEKGMVAYLKKDIKQAYIIFRRILEYNRADKVALIYYKRCAYLLKYGIPSDWDGISLLTKK